MEAQAAIVPVEVQAQGGAVTAHPAVGEGFQGDGDIAVALQEEENQRRAVKAAVRGGVVEPVFQDAQGGVEQGFLAQILFGGAYGGDFQDEVRGLADVPSPVGVVGQHGVAPDAEGDVAVGGDEAAGVALLVVEECVAADQHIVELFQVGAQDGGDLVKQGFLVESVRQGFTVRVGVVDAVVVVGD